MYLWGRVCQYEPYEAHSVATGIFHVRLDSGARGWLGAPPQLADEFGRVKLPVVGGVPKLMFLEDSDLC